MIAVPTETMASDSSPQPDSFRQALRLAMIFAAVKLAIHLATNLYTPHLGYGLLPDELYFIVCGGISPGVMWTRGRWLRYRRGWRSRSSGYGCRGSAFSRPWRERCKWG